MRKSYERYGAVTYYQIKVTDAEQTEKMQKKVYLVMEVISVAVKIIAEVVRCMYRSSNGQRTVNKRTCNMYNG